MKYDVTSYPQLLVFANGYIEGEEYRLKKEPKAIADYMMALSTDPTLVSNPHPINSILT